MDTACRSHPAEGYRLPANNTPKAKAYFAERNRQILEDYANGLSTGQIAKSLGMSKKRVWQIRWVAARRHAVPLPTDGLDLNAPFTGEDVEARLDGKPWPQLENNQDRRKQSG